MKRGSSRSTLFLDYLLKSVLRLMVTGLQSLTTQAIFGLGMIILFTKNPQQAQTAL